MQGLWVKLLRNVEDLRLNGQTPQWPWERELRPGNGALCEAKPMARGRLKVKKTIMEGGGFDGDRRDALDPPEREGGLHRRARPSTRSFPFPHPHAQGVEIIAVSQGKKCEVPPTGGGARGHVTMRSGALFASYDGF